MAVTFVEATSTATGTTSLTITPGGGSTDSSINFLSVGCKPYNAVVATPEGWSLLTTGTNGTTATGADVGSMQVNTYVKLGDIGVTPISITTTGGASNTIEGSLSTWSKATTEVWDYDQFTVSQDTSNGANISAAGGADILLATGDVILTAFGANSDAGSAASITVTATSATLGSYNALNNTATANGDDMIWVSGYNAVTAGASSAAPVLAYTNASSSSGTGTFVRIRVLTLGISVDYAIDSDVNPGIEVTLTNVPVYLPYKLVRATVSGEYADTGVRGHDEVLSGSDTVVAVDYEAPLDQDLQYTINILLDEAIVATVDASSTIKFLGEVDSGAPLEYFHIAFLKSVSQPALNLRIALREFDTWSHNGRVLGNFEVLGRRNPVVITDVLGGRSGTFTFYSWTPEALADSPMELDWGSTKAAVDALLREGDVLLLQTTSEFTGQDMFLKVTNVSVKRMNKPPTLIGSGIEHIPLLIWEITFVEVDQPSTTGVDATFATWQAVLDDPSYSDWNGALGFGTWLGLLQEYS